MKSKLIELHSNIVILLIMKNFLLTKNFLLLIKITVFVVSALGATDVTLEGR